MNSKYTYLTSLHKLKNARFSWDAGKRFYGKFTINWFVGKMCHNIFFNVLFNINISFQL